MFNIRAVPFSLTPADCKGLCESSHYSYFNCFSKIKVGRKFLHMLELGAREALLLTDPMDT